MSKIRFGCLTFTSGATMLDLNIDYLQSTQMCVSYNTMTCSWKSHLENRQFKALKGKNDTFSKVNVNQNVAWMVNISTLF